MNKSLRLNFFISETIFFIINQIFGLFCGITIYKAPSFRQTLAQGTQVIPWWHFIIYFSVIVYVALKYIRAKKPFRFFYYFLIFFGSFFVFNIWLSETVSLVLSLFVLFLRYIQPRVLFQDLAIVLAVVGASVALGLLTLPWHVIIVLMILSVYDMIAVWKTKHMQMMFKKLVEKGVHFAVIIPNRFEGLLARLEFIKTGGDFLFLGTGDVAFPIIFAVSALRQGIASSIAVITGAVVGLVFIHFAFLIQKERQPAPALPPISLGCILGYLMSLIV